MLRLDLDGNWEPEDFIEVLRGVESLYYKAAIERSYRHQGSIGWIGPWRSTTFEDYVEEANSWFLSEARAIALPHERLRIASVEYGSPGNIDFLGVGKVCEVLANVIGRSVVFVAEHDLRWERTTQAKLETRKLEIELEGAEESVRALKLANAQKLLEIRRDFPDWSEDQFLLLAVSDQDKILPRISEGKLVGARSAEDEPPR